MTFKGFILFLISIILLVILFPIGLTWAIFTNKNLDKMFWKMAYSVDQFGNVILADFMNVILIKGKEHTFGDPDETISSVLGKNKAQNTLRVMGKSLVRLLDFFDKDHVNKAIENSSYNGTIRR